MKLPKGVYVVVKPGKELTSGELETINIYRKIAFDSNVPTNPKPGNEDWEYKYFLGKDEKENILVFGILRNTQIEFIDKIYFVLEFISVVSIQKRKGYGSYLMNQIKEYAKKENKTLIGFCTDDLVPFYLKNGFETTASSTERFIFKKDQWSFPGETPGEAIYIGGKDGLVEEMSKDPQQKAYITRHRKIS